MQPRRGSGDKTGGDPRGWILMFPWGGKVSLPSGEQPLELGIDSALVI